MIDLKQRLDELADDSGQRPMIGPDDLLRRAHDQRTRRRVAGGLTAGAVVVVVAALALVVPGLGRAAPGPADGSGADAHAEAVRLARQLSLTTRIESTPRAYLSDGARHLGYLGLPVWFWLADRQPSHVLAKNDGTVWVRAQYAGTEWDLGNGEKLHCRTLGTPHRDSDGVGRSPDCGVKYRHPGSYTVTAHVRWRLTWGTGQGAAKGTLPDRVSTASERLRIADLHVLDKR